MMEHQAFLFALAEVAATVVGFSMVVGVIRPEARAARLRRATMYDIALVGFAAVGASLLPYVLAAHGLSSTAIWRVSSLALLFAWLSGDIAARRRFRKRHGTLLLTPLWGRTVAFANLLVVGIGNGILLWNVVLPGPDAGARYLLALLGFLSLTAFFVLNAVFADTK